MLLIAYASVSFFIFPYADDFTYALKGRLPNFVQTVFNERETWNGRYLSNFLLIGSPLNWGGLSCYRLMPVLLLVISWFGLFFGFKNFQAKYAILMSSVILATILSSLPDTGEGLYWMSGAWTYLPAAILLFLEFSFLFKKHSKSTSFIPLLFILVIGSGFNELFSLISCLLIIVKLLENRGNWLWFLLVVQILLFYYVWSAPGNSYRASLFSNNHQVLQTIKLTTLYSARFIGEWMLNPLVYLLGYIFVTDSNFKIEVQVLKRPVLILFLTVVPTVIACLGPIWSTGILGQHRTPNMTCFLFFPILFITISSNRAFLVKFLKPNKTFIFPLTVFLLMFWKNNYFLIEDFTTRKIARFSSQLEERVQLLTSCKEGECLVPAIIDQPRTFNVYRLEPDPEHWKNKSYQLFYNSGKVIPDYNR